MTKFEETARAIFYSGFHPLDIANGNAALKWDEWPEDRRRAQRQARAAVVALKKMNQAMIDAAQKGSREEMGSMHSSMGLAPYMIPDLWEAALDVVLFEKDETSAKS